MHDVASELIELFIKMWCAVFGCNNNNDNGNKKFNFFTFPKNKKHLEQWLKFCNRKDTFNIKTAVVCSAHFNETDFANNMQYKMGFSKTRFLVSGAIPTVMQIKSSSVPTKRRQEVRPIEVKAKRRKENVDLNLEPEPDNDYDEVTIDYSVQHNMEEINPLQTEIEQLQEENLILKFKEHEHLELISKLQEQLSKVTAEKQHMEDRLKNILNS